MVDSMNQGRADLARNPGRQPARRPDAFTVIFFHDDVVLETPPAGLKPGRRAEQVKALDWMAPESGNMRPRGKSRPLAALRLAASYHANEVVLLTDDNFGLRSGEDVSPAALARNWKRPMPATMPCPPSTPCSSFTKTPPGRLKDIANHFGGRYQFVEEPPFDARPVPSTISSAAERRVRPARDLRRPADHSWGETGCARDRGAGRTFAAVQVSMVIADQTDAPAPGKRCLRRVGQGSATHR